MKLCALETVRTQINENLLWVRVETESGLEGLGETFFAPATVEAYLHEVVAPLVLGRDAADIGAINRQLIRYPVGYASSGVEMRAASAVDIALWDLFGRSVGRPLHAMLGGRARKDIRIYNTCAGPHYVAKRRGTDVDTWFGTNQKPHPLDDLHAFEEEPERLARELLAEGITGMKIWPFDRAAFANGGVDITPAQLEAGLAPFRRIRDAVGSAMDLMVELHALWDLASARRIVRAIEPLSPLWIEDPVRMDDNAALATLANDTRIPLLASETLAPASSFASLIASRAVGIVSLDPGWCGGISQARAICDMAAAAQLPVAVHDCTGPIGYVAGTHLSIHAPTAMIQETVRAYTRGWYADVVTELPPIANGRLCPLDGPGLGTTLKPAFLASPTTLRRRSQAGTAT
ncbi:MAG: mandelate racemase/muconate lactonizing enzyme family protein [Telmatospirillum sp.]|nr:mandelate racemase/muconate lactonizing enzyme family protein [Telmatospirillum sp.]